MAKSNAAVADETPPRVVTKPSAVTLHQLRIFWAVAQARSFTKASKLLDLAQPSLSQQISKLEEEVGAQLFNRNRNEMTPTDAGAFLLRKAEVILSSVEEALVGLEEFAAGTRGVLAVGALSSIARNLLPETMRLLSARFPDLELDIHETAPAEAVDLLYGRRLNVAMLATDSAAASGTSFHETKICTDPYVLAVPRGIDLSEVHDVERDLAPEQRAIINSTIQFNFGNQHKKRIEDWYQHVLPHYRVVAQSRTYEVALSMVQEGLGVAVLPALTAAIGPGRTFDVDLYRTTLPDREIVAMMPSQYARVEPFASFIEVLQEAGKHAKLPPIKPLPPLLKAL
jgi:DNA-binding transcriptional LysR family regulator